MENDPSCSETATRKIDPIYREEVRKETERLLIECPAFQDCPEIIQGAIDLGCDMGKIRASWATYREDELAYGE